MSSQTAEDRLIARMKGDWDRRAAENARWYINTLRIDQSEEEFDRTGEQEIAQWILPELSLLTQGREPATLRLLEIGCGIGRMTRPLAGIFGEVHATDVSGEMIRQARVRLADLPNVFLHETSGADVGPLPDDYFDLVFSVFVFQHVPSREAIRSTLRDAYRALKPGGLMRFQTNGVTAAEFQAVAKDTWAGETFSEEESRALARELGAQLVSVYGAGTMYCFSTWRKPRSEARPIDSAMPVIEYHGRADRPEIQAIPAAGDDAWLSLLVSGIDLETADANRIGVEIGGRIVQPRYAGPVRPHFEHVLPAERIAEICYLEVGIPPHLPPGRISVRVLPEKGEASGAIAIDLVESPAASPRIATVRNGFDYGMDVEVGGPKASLALFVDGIDGTATIENVRLRLGNREFAPDFVGFDVAIAGYRVDAKLPAGLTPGEATIQLIVKGIASPPMIVRLNPR